MITISSDPSKMDILAIHAYLTRSYWAAGISYAAVEKSIRHSLCFGAFTEGGSQVGFVRVITDYTTFGYLCDVFVLESHRKQGISKLMLSEISRHPELQGFRRWILGTRDAHGLYAQFGYKPLSMPERYMEIRR